MRIGHTAVICLNPPLFLSWLLLSSLRLPGWDKHSYGYHGDDGNSFCSSGTGQAYGPTFTTNDIIGKNVLRRNQGQIYQNSEAYFNLFDIEIILINFQAVA